MKLSYPLSIVWFVLLVLGFTPVAAAAPGAMIKHIEVTGARRISPETVLANVSLKTGERYDRAKANSVIHALFATGQYRDVRISEANGTVRIAVVENPAIAAIAFKGNSEIKSDKLKEAIKLKTGEAFTQAKADASVKAVRELYRSEGRMTSEVKATTAARASGETDVTFEITEGAVNRVASITFQGNNAYTAEQLENVIRTVRSGWFDILRPNSIYVPERLEDDKEALWRHYMTHGYPEVKIRSAEGKASTDGKGYDVVFIIEEGDRFEFGRISIDSLVSGIDRDALHEHVLIHEGEPYDASLIDKTTEELALELWKSGNRFARVSPKITRDAKTHRADIAFRVEEGAHVTIARIEIKGNKKTNADVILREMELKEGDAFQQVMLERDRKHIMALGIFKSVKVSGKPSSAKETADVMVNVVEDETINFSVGGGYSSSEGIIADTSIEEKNLFGTGRAVKLKLAGSLYRLQAEASLIEPHLLGTNLVGGVDLFYKDYDASEQSSFKSVKAGTALRVSSALSDNWTGSLNYKFSRNEIYDVGANASPAIRDAVPGFPDTTTATYYTSSVGYSLAYDTLNARKLPTAGTSFVLSQDFAGAGGDVRYIKTTVDARHYFELSKTSTLVTRATAGTIGGWGGQNVRLLDMFYMGGEAVRGFDVAGIGPRDILSANKDALGGTSYISTTAEARFNAPFLPEDSGLKFAVFADAGSLFGNTASATKFPGVTGTAASLRASVGAGLIWDSPIGALRADYAIPVAKETFDKTRPWSFGLATF